MHTRAGIERAIVDKALVHNCRPICISRNYKDIVSAILHTLDSNSTEISSSVALHSMHDCMYVVYTQHSDL